MPITGVLRSQIIKKDLQATIEKELLLNYVHCCRVKLNLTLNASDVHLARKVGTVQASQALQFITSTVDYSCCYNLITILRKLLECVLIL
jgi:hypothetical protein